MCGIAGVHLKNPNFVKSHEGLEAFINALYLGIESRGRRATGIVAVEAGGKVGTFEKADITASDFIEIRDPLPENVRTILCHTRFDTKGDPKDNKNNHPVLYGSTFAIHNGAIFNDDKLFEESGLQRKGEVDSEIISALLDKEGLEKAQAVLEKLRGHVAIAAIDPVRFPDRLLLAKGDSSPLVVLENENFVVWASTQLAIKDAWGQILGTPPTWKKFHTFNRGEFWVIQDDAVEKSKYEVLEAPTRVIPANNNRRTVDHSGRQHTCNDGGETQYGWGNDWADTDWDTRERDKSAANDHTTPWTKKDFRNQVAAIRAAGRGLARVMGDDDNDMTNVTRIIWQRCTGCNTSVLADDVRATLSWGRMCLDCYECCVETKKNEYSNPAAVLNDQERITLNNWSKIESTVHDRALSKLAEKVELSEEVIEWLIFRVPETYTNRHKNLSDLAANLDDMYQEILREQFDSLGIKDATDPKQTIDRRAEKERKALPSGHPLVGCAKHGITYPEHGSCSECLRSGGSPFNASAPPTTYCLTCGNRKPKRIQKGRIRIGKFVWCNKHYEECNNKNCSLAGIERKDSEGKKVKYGLAVATTPDGTRLCHYCVRGTKGCLFDGQHDVRGIEVVSLPA